MILRSLFPALLLLSCHSLLSSVLADASGTQLTAQQFLNQANVLLSAGQYAEALRAYDSAIEQDPGNYLSFFKRGTAKLSLGRSSAALEDFDRILSLNPDFHQAHLQKAKVLTKDGQLDKAKASIDAYLRHNKKDVAGGEVAASIQTARSALASASSAHKRKRWDECVASATKALEVAPNSVEARRTRAECQLGKGDVESAVADYSRIAHISPPTSPSLYLRLSSLSFYVLNDAEMALSHLKACLHSDPESKACKAKRKAIKAVDKSMRKAKNFAEGGSWRQVISSIRGTSAEKSVVDKVMETIESDQRETGGAEDAYSPPIPADMAAKESSRLLLHLHSTLCKAYVQTGEAGLRKAQEHCEEALRRNGDDVDALVGKAEGLMKKEEWEEAVRVLSSAFEKTGSSDREVHAKLQKAQRLLKQSKRKDYYKILGVSRDADKKTIKKAYRKKTLTEHPDKGGSEDKMATLNEAFEVLNNDELRARYDNGEDPRDPMGNQQQQQQQQQAYQFFQGQGGFQFAGGPGGMPFQHAFFGSGGGGRGPRGPQFAFV